MLSLGDCRVHPLLWTSRAQNLQFVCLLIRTRLFQRHKKSLRTNARVRSAGLKVAKTKWHVNSGRPTTSETLQTSYLLLSSLHEVICSPLNGTCFMSENNVVCLMISSASPVQREALDTCIPSPGSVLFFYSMNAICQVKMRKKWGQHMGPPSVCVCVCLRDRERETEGARGREFFPLYFGELERRLSSSLFPTNQVLPTCQPRRDARPFKTLC